MRKKLYLILLKIAFCLFLCLIGFSSLSAQSEEIKNFNQKRLKINQTGMYILGGWAVGNIATNTILLGKAEGRDKYFYQMNVFWNVVNLGLAGGTLLGSKKQRNKIENYTVYESFKEQNTVEKLFLFNTALDLGYMAGGLYLSERGKNQADIIKKERLDGFGKAVILQGAFLFVFDLSMYFIHQNNFKKAAFLKNIHLSSSGLGMIIRF